ncbi:hypothetical protein DWZ14_15490 [Enterocloster citroniae]|nr:hypothetical protein DWZ14_15490 [Enterocloster citroniae]
MRNLMNIFLMTLFYGTYFPKSRSYVILCQARRFLRLLKRKAWRVRKMCRKMLRFFLLVMILAFMLLVYRCRIMM